MPGKSKTANWSEILPFPQLGDEVVISGIAGRFAESDNLTHFKENLFNKRDLITDDDRRWKSDNSEIPQRTGKVNHLEKFDAQFFGIPSDEVKNLDPMGRMLLEHAHEAIIDAGVNPRKLRGTNTGVFIGSCSSESEAAMMYREYQGSGFIVPGCNRGMLANRISNWLGTIGPSYAVDTACSSSLFAMDQAYRAIRSGQCDAALVGGSNLCLSPNVSLGFSRLGVLSPDGSCKSFDADANGYCRSEAVSVIYLQKSKDAKRVYATVVYTKTNCDGFKEQGITYPSGDIQRDLLQQFYEECGIPPTSLAFLEAHGTGTKVGDPVELSAIEKVFCPGRTTPLRIGSIKSNLGHTEPASGLCSIAKILVAMESGFIPPNINYNRPLEGVRALEDGSIQVISDLTPWDGGYVGVNSFGFGGANAHVLLKSNPKEKVNNGAPKDDLPRLVAVSGRTEEAVSTLLDYLEARPVDVEFASLLYNIHGEEIPGHIYRGYTILLAEGISEQSVRHVQHYPGVKRPVSFVFSGVGTQWTGTCDALLKIPTFAKAIQRCDIVLKPLGVNIIDILTSKGPNVWGNILNSFVGIAAVQIGLVDVLTSIGIVPDYIIGHSIGESGCAYADGCLTAEQVVLMAYYQASALMEAETVSGLIADVELDRVNLKSLCPSDIEVACHNGPESSTISGPADSMKNFVARLQANEILVREVPSNKIPYHSCHIATVGPKLLTYLKRIIQDPKPRSTKWLSTSVPRNKWKTSSAGLCSPEYHTNNLLNPVFFEETFNLILNNGIIIEMTPHGLLHAILQKYSNGSMINIALNDHGNTNHIETLLQAIGRMYEVGLHPQLTKLYPDVEYPVSRGTSMISPLVRWKHSDNWSVISHTMINRIDSGWKNVEITLTDEAYEWMAGHVIDGRNLVPATGYLVLVWETVSLMRGELYDEVSVVFEDIRFHRATTIPNHGGVNLAIMIHKGSGRFEVSEGNTTIVTGFVRVITNAVQERVSNDMLTNNDEPLVLTDRDIYKELRLRGYQYAGLCRGLQNASLNGTKGRIKWTRNWAAFMDNMLQMKILGNDTRGLFVPTGIQRLVIAAKVHLDLLRAMPIDDEAFTIEIYKDFGIIVAGGIEIRGLKANAISKKKPAEDPVLEEMKFVAHRDGAEMVLKAVTRIAIHIALENHYGVKIKTIEMICDTGNASPENLSSPILQEILDDLPLLQANVNIIAPTGTFPTDALPSTIHISQSEKLATESDALLVIGHGLLASKNIKILRQLQQAMKNSGFLLAREPLNKDAEILSTIQSESLDVILEKRTNKERVLLLRKKQELCRMVTVIQINNHEFTWLPELQAALKAESERKSRKSIRILLVSQGDNESGLVGLVNCLRQEPGGDVVQGLLIQDLQAPKFSLENSLYAEQLDLGLTMNVLRPGKLWGSYRFFAMNLISARPVHHIRIHQPTRGDLSSLQWIEGPIQPGDRHRDMIEVHYSSINFRDVMIGTGKLAVEAAAKSRKLEENMIGFEYSGRDMNGRAVMGMTAAGAFSNLCIADSEFLWPVPDDWTLEDAATIPVVYSTAYYALLMIGRMKKGEKVLIHAGSGGVGQAAITLALYEGCEVFTTVGTPEKRLFIRNQFPQIDDDHIGNSRDTSFEQLILRQTQGRGVDIVVNSLAEEKLLASVRCLTNGGRFLEIGKFDLAANNLLGMETFLKGISFHGVLVDNLFLAPSKTKTELAALLAEALKNGAVKPLVRTVFPLDQAELAFRHMAAGKHIGKVILKIRDGNEVRQLSRFRGIPRYYCLKNSSYLILGGLGGFGLELADWLVLRGATKLVLTSRKGITSGYQRLRISIWKSYGVKIVIVVGKDASTHEGCENILKQATALGPVDAIFNLAVVLKDDLCENQTVESFEESFRAKAWATKQLDKLSRILCPHLRKFVVFSSVSCGRGNIGQTNYGMANSIMERICETRVAENLPALAVQWGAIGDVGLVAEMHEDHKEVVIGGTLQQRISSCLQELDGFLQQNSPVVSSMVVAKKTAGGAGATNIIDTVVNIMGVKNLKTVSLHTPLAELGMDSMMAVEIKQTLEREFGVFLTAQDIRGLTFLKLQEMSLEPAETGENPEEITNKKNDLGGIEMFIRTLGTGQINEDVCVPLVTAAEDERGETFIVPGIEGTQSVFQPIAHKLKSPTTCLQLGTTHVGLTSIDDMADYFIPHVRSRSKGRRDFAVVGYSFGSIVAIELVRRLEAEGFCGRLLLIDGSPDLLRAMIEQYLPANDSEGLQSKLLLHFMAILEPSINAQLAIELEKCHTWEEKLTAFTKSLDESKSMNFTREYQEAICTSIYSRIKAVQIYDPSARELLRTPITLLRTKIQAVRLLSEAYGLQSITQGKVDVHYVEGNHTTMLDDDICAAAINGELI